MADTHGIVQYARTYIRRYTHTHTHTQKVGNVGGEKSKRKRGVHGRKKEKTERKKAKEGGKEGEKREKGGGGRKKEETKRKQGKERGRGMGRGAWVPKRVGPHTNNARST